MARILSGGTARVAACGRRGEPANQMAELLELRAAASSQTERSGIANPFTPAAAINQRGDLQ